MTTGDDVTATAYYVTITCIAHSSCAPSRFDGSQNCSFIKHYWLHECVITVMCYASLASAVLFNYALLFILLLMVYFSSGLTVTSGWNVRFVSGGSLQNVQGHRVNTANRITPDHTWTLILTLHLILTVTQNPILTLSAVTLLALYIMQWPFQVDYQTRWTFGHSIW